MNTRGSLLPFGISPKALFAYGAVVLAACSFPSPSVSATACESLAKLALPDTKITLAKPEPAGTFTPPKPIGLPKPMLESLPAFCRVAGEIKPTKDSNIKFEVWMLGRGGFANN